jgi:hypothetical protein
MSAEAYTNAANELVGRILKLIPAHPEILIMDGAWDLFKVEGFKCDDLEPTLAQANWALAKAKADYIESTAKM